MSSAVSRAARFDFRHNTYGIGRSLLALATFSALVTTPAGALFPPVLGRPQAPACGGVTAISGFCLGPGSVGLDARRLVLAALLIPVIIGWRPRYFGVLHWWVTFSFVSSIALPDGGDSVALIMSGLLIPLTLADGRTWQWTRASVRNSLSPGVAAFCFVTVMALRIQVAGIYFNASVAKFGVAQWADGTALYYWLNNRTFGLWEPLRQLAEPLLGNALFLGALTWSVLLIELSLGLAIFWPQRVRSKVFWLGIALHTGIALCMGLVSFALIMFGALVLALRPIEERTAIPRLRRTAAAVPAPKSAPEPAPAAAKVPDESLV
jgi:antimicrobial peptide system SdpB family protein